MNLKPKRHQSPEINLTPLIDIAFLMLIFFMVATTFERESAVKIDLPQASPSESRVEELNVEVTVNAKGEFFLNRVQVLNRDPETLKAAIVKHAGNNKQRPFIIRADAQAPHQSVVTVMDVAGQLGFSRISIPTVKSESAEK